MQSQKHEERRRYPRKPCHLTVGGFDKDSAFKGVAKNISLGGAFIETTHPFTVNKEVFLSFFERDPVKVVGKVAWTASDGAGISFKNTPQRLAMAIKFLVPYLTSSTVSS